MAGEPFLVVEFRAPSLLFAAFTAKYPGTKVDLIGDLPVERRSGDPATESAFMVRGCSPAQFDRLEAQITETYGVPRDVRCTLADRAWFGRVRMAHSVIDDPMVDILTRYRDRYGAPWVHVSGGFVYVRARLNPGVDGETLVEELRDAAAIVGARPQIDLQYIAGLELGVWKDLIRESMQLPPRR